MSEEQENDDSDQGESSPIPMTFIPGQRRSPGRPIDPDAPLLNDEALPIFPNASKRESKIATVIAVTKLDPPGHGYKGQIPAASNLDYVARQWGDGNYTFEVLNGKNEVLRKREGVSVSCGVKPEDALVNKRVETVVTPKTNGDTSELLAFVRELQTNTEKHNAALLAQVKELAKSHADMVMQSSRDAATRDHDYHRTQMLTQEGLFKTILATVQTNSETLVNQLQSSHDRQIQWQDMSFKQTYAMIMGLHKHEKEMLNTQMKFLEENAGSDEEPWLKAITVGVEGIKQLKELAANAGTISEKRRLLKKVRMVEEQQKRRGKTSHNPAKTEVKVNKAGTTMRRAIRHTKEDAPKEEIEYEG